MSNLRVDFVFGRNPALPFTCIYSGGRNPALPFTCIYSGLVFAHCMEHGYCFKELKAKVAQNDTAFIF
jgi:hypothetical protein